MSNISARYVDWLQSIEAQGALAVFEGKTLLGQVGHGTQPDTVFEIASLSKAITAVCISELVQTSRLSWDDTFNEVYGKGPEVSLRELVTHSGGLWPDGTQLAMPFWFDQPGPFGEDVLRLMDMRGGQGAEPGQYKYNNENYALLGLIIETVSGVDYEEICTQLVLKPAGATGSAAEHSGAFMPWGGWGMTVADYAKFMAHWFSRGGEIGQDPFAFPHVSVAGTLHYGLGINLRSYADGYNFWHSGALCFPRRFEVGSFAVTSAEGWTVVAAYDTCLPAEVVRDMQTLLVNTMRNSE